MGRLLIKYLVIVSLVSMALIFVHLYSSTAGKHEYKAPRSHNNSPVATSGVNHQLQTNRKIKSTREVSTHFPVHNNSNVRSVLNTIEANNLVNYRPLKPLGFTTQPNSTVEMKRKFSEVQSKQKQKLWDALQKRTTKEVFVLALHYTDQLTGGTMNLLSLQCWTNTLNGNTDRIHGAKVVEPFIQQGSRFGVTLLTNAKDRFMKENSVRLRDIFDWNKWSEYTIEKEYAGLMRWEYFLQRSTRFLVLVYQGCENCTDCAENYEGKKLSKKTKAFFQKHNFKVVRTVCYQTKTGYTNYNFKRLIYGPYSHTNVSVIFNTWGGIVTPSTSGGDRLSLIALSQCARTQNDGYISPSVKVLSDSEEYVRRFITPNASKEYIAVMFRMEYYAIWLKDKGIPKESHYDRIMKCIRQVASDVEQLKHLIHSDSVFLAMDYGKYGSVGFRQFKESKRFSLTIEELKPLSQKLYHELFGNSSSLEDWEDSFDRVADIKSPGYVAMMQKSLAARATCLVLVGGGSFQKTAELMYTSSHHSRNGGLCLYHACEGVY